jgi:hypothetical protein
MIDWRWHLNIIFVRMAIWLLNSTGWYKGYWNHWRTMFAYTERRGLHVMPVHYYSPIPNTQNLPRELWRDRRLLPSIELNVDVAAELLEGLMHKYSSECRELPLAQSRDPHEYFLENAAYGRGDADVLYSILRDIKPRKIIEIGSGYSTLLISQAIRANRQELRDYECEFIAIEPYPPLYLVPPPANVTRLEVNLVQNVPLREFTSLAANDVLFMDSSHTVKIGSDVVFEFLSILPSLASGVLIHIHDIFTPFEYPHDWIEKSRFFWNEQYLLEAFLSYNTNFEVIMPLNALSRLHPECLANLIPSFEHHRHSVSSFWIRRR